MRLRCAHALLCYLAACRQSGEVGALPHGLRDQRRDIENGITIRVRYCRSDELIFLLRERAECR